MQRSERLVSLDVFRGFTMASMVLVNNPGDWGHVYPQLAHSSWNGFTFTDMIFPFFLWIAGVSSTFSFASRRARGDSNTQLVTQIVRRFLLIFAIGVFLYAFPFGLFGTDFSVSTMRILGVLQRIAICYLIGSLAYLYLPVGRLWVLIAGLFAAYWAMMAWIPVPGIGAGLWEPGRNFAAWVDNSLLTTHNWMYTKTWDPEGIVSTIPAIGTFLFGVLTGEYLRTSHHSKEEKTSWLFVTGGVLLFVSVVWDMWLPINKSIWTPSYVLMMAGWAHLVFATCYFLFDAKNYRKGLTPFLVFGMNAIFIYVAASIYETLVGVITIPATLPDGTAGVLSLHDWSMARIFTPLFSPYNASLASGLSTVLVMFLLGWVMWKRKWFVKI